MQLYLSLIFIVDQESAEIVIQNLDLDPPTLKASIETAEIANCFENSYGIAHRFFYNPIFSKSFPFEYCGRFHDHHLERREYECNIDLVVCNRKRQFNKNDAVETKINQASFHVHFQFSNALFDQLNCGNDDVYKSIAAWVGEFYGKVIPTNEIVRIRKFDDFVGALLRAAPNREHALPLTIYTYYALSGIRKTDFTAFDFKNVNEDLLERVDKKSAEKIKRNAKNIYRLLFSHAEGVSEKVAIETLSQNAWRSSNFFVNYFKPDCMVSVATPFPDDDRQWIAKYDRIPDYPPLKYLGLIALEFSGLHEEVMRGIYEYLLNIRKSKWTHVKILNTLLMFPGILKKEREMFLIRNHDYLRLPITRPMVQSLIESKLQQDIQAVIGELRASLLNAAVWVIAVLGFGYAMVKFLYTGMEIQLLLDLWQEIADLFDVVFQWLLGLVS